MSFPDIAQGGETGGTPALDHKDGIITREHPER